MPSTIETKADIQAFFSNFTIEAGCRFGFKGIQEQLGTHGITIPKGQIISIVDTSTNEGSPDVGRVKTAEQAGKFVNYGWIPVVHLAAGRIKDEAALYEIISRMTDVGVTSYLLLAGDPKIPVGSLRTAMDLARALDRFHNTNIERIFWAGHPYGNPNASNNKNVWAELHAKSKYAKDHPKIDTSIISQVCYTSWLFERWVKALRNEGIEMPVRAGILLGDMKVKLDFAKTTFIPDPSKPENFTTRSLKQLFTMVVMSLPDEMKQENGQDISKKMIEDMVGVTQAMGLKKAGGIGLAHMFGGLSDLLKPVPDHFISSLAQGATTGTGLAVAPHFFSGTGKEFVEAMLLLKALREGNFNVHLDDGGFDTVALKAA